MDSFEWNKIIGAVLGSLIFIFVIKTIGENIYEAEKPAKPGYVVEGVVEESTGVSTVAAPEALPATIGNLALDGHPIVELF